MFKNMLNEFKTFAMRGNMIDMAVGIIIGAAFGKVVSSLVSDIIMPPIGFILGRVDFSNLSITLHEKTADMPAVVISYGLFINTLIDFIIIAFAVFIVIKQVNRFAPVGSLPGKPTTQACPYCCTDIPIQAKRCPHCTSQL
ncbi:MAG: large-conductance mechanosensitive channel protein MscL [Legionellales bacterium]|jgi:large conductance mechanosensitive channel